MVEQASMSRNTVNIGTPLYMAPEQLDGSRIDHTADLYALGHIAFELLTGESYWEHEVRTAPNALTLMKWIDRGLPEAASTRAARLGVHVTPIFDAWFIKATSSNPQERFRTAGELVEGFAAALGAAPATAAATTSYPPSVGRKARRITEEPTLDRDTIRRFSPVTSSRGATRSAWAHPWIWIASSAAAGVVGVLVFVFVMDARGRQSTTEPPAEAVAAPAVLEVPVASPEVRANDPDAEATPPTSASVVVSVVDAPSSSATSRKPSSASKFVKPAASAKAPAVDCRKHPDRCRR
jgi:serine/threonine-protein kinase